MMDWFVLMLVSFDDLIHRLFVEIELMDVLLTLQLYVDVVHLNVEKKVKNTRFYPHHFVDNHREIS